MKRRDVQLMQVETRDWSELPADALTVVFAKLGIVGVLMGAGLVCHSWLNAAKMPDLWRSVEMSRLDLDVMTFNENVLCAMAKVAVDRSDGRLEVFKGHDFVSDELLKHIGNRSPYLKVLSLSCYSPTRVTLEGFSYLTKRCRLLEDIFYDCRIVQPLLVLAELQQLRYLTLQGTSISKKG
uniref:F-box domain-containing protein n=1 Tax=Leersia perrieri TaxID=77586 RepID=A0A0D9XUH3_9ORYZ